MAAARACASRSRRSPLRRMALAGRSRPGRFHSPLELDSRAERGRAGRRPSRLCPRRRGCRRPGLPRGRRDAGPARLAVVAPDHLRGLGAGPCARPRHGVGCAEWPFHDAESRGRCSSASSLSGNPRGGGMAAISDRVGSGSRGGRRYRSCGGGLGGQRSLAGGLGTIIRNATQPSKVPLSQAPARLSRLRRLNLVS